MKTIKIERTPKRGAAAHDGRGGSMVVVARQGENGAGRVRRGGIFGFCQVAFEKIRIPMSGISHNGYHWVVFQDTRGGSCCIIIETLSVMSK